MTVSELLELDPAKRRHTFNRLPADYQAALLDAMTEAERALFESEAELFAFAGGTGGGFGVGEFPGAKE